MPYHTVPVLACETSIAVKLLTARASRVALDFVITCVMPGLALFALATVLPVRAEDAPALSFTVNAYQIVGDNPLSAAATAAVLAPHTGAQSSLDGLVAAADALTAALRAAGYPFHRAFVPPQTLEAGVVQIEVRAARVGSVSVTGNSHFDETNVLRTAPGLIVGEIPDMQRLSRGLALANQHPARQVVLTLEEGKKPNEVGAVLEVKDSKPWTLFTGINNIGTDRTGVTRLTVGGQYSNFWNRDHIGTFSYTTSLEQADAVTQLAFNYRIPFYARGGTLTLYHTRSDVDSGTLQQLGSDFSVSGAGRFTGAAYTQVLPNRGAYRQSLSLALDDRLFVSDVVFGATPLFGDARSRPVSLRYDGAFRAARWSASFNIGFAANTSWGENDNDRAYAIATGGTPGARGVPDAQWYVLRYGASGVYALPRAFELRAEFDGQWAGEPLIPGEQFGLGGASSVRGFEERALSGDRGDRLSLELWLPPAYETLRFLGFFDVGHVDTDEATAGERDSETIASAGLGVRWSYKDSLAFSADYGHELIDAADPAAGGIKWHLSLSYRY